MGIPIDKLTDKMRSCLSAKDQEIYGAPIQAASPQSKLRPLERAEQRTFARWCQLKDYAFVWHSPAHKTRATIGCPDFIVALGGVTLWIEFKRAGGHLSAEQEAFRNKLAAQKALYWIVGSAAEAIAIAQDYANAH